jgi:hypothetical protein
MGLKPGYLVSKHVQLVSELKQGGMGSVWIAEHLALHTQVAVKFMATSIVDDASAVARFSREAMSAAQIKSPHVVQIHDHGVTPEGVPYMVMELLHGEDLSTRIKRLGQVPLEDAAQVVYQTCRVLSRAHKAGIIHRDIKPSNIFLLDTDGEIFVKVLDFGVAKMGDDEGNELTTTGAMVGTLVYMSPEQLLSAKTVDHRADLWSLGVVVYRALAGELPFKNEDGLGSLCRAVEKAAFAAPSMRVPGLPPAIDAWFERAFAAKLEERFTTAKEMAAALQHAMRVSAAHLPASQRDAVLAHLPRADGLGDNETISEPANSRRLAAKGAEPTLADRTAVTKYEELAGPTSGTPALTLAGTAATRPVVPHRVTSRRIAIGAVVALGLLSGVAGLRGWGPFRRGVASTASASAGPVTEKVAAIVTSAPPPVSLGPAAATSAKLEVTVASDTATAEASKPPATAPSASSSATAGPAGKGRGRPTGGRPGPEKDYGF